MCSFSSRGAGCHYCLRIEVPRKFSVGPPTIAGLLPKTSAVTAPGSTGLEVYEFLANPKP